MSNNKIRVVYGEIKRESVLIDPKTTVAMGDNEDASNVIAQGESTASALKKYHGKN